jgi:DNA mismatch repair protein MutS2
VNRHALEVLEFPRVLEVVAGQARTELGAERVRELHPRSDTAWIEMEHARVAAVRTLRGEEPPWTPDPVPDLRQPLEKLRVAGASWSALELHSGLQLLRSSRRTGEALRDPRRSAAARAVLADLRDALPLNKEAESALDRAIADDATLRDDASPLLRRLRRELRTAEADLIRLLERQLERMDAAHRVPDMSVTMRNGRYVVPVRREGRSAVGGIVHDASASGATLFVEPPAAVEFGNRIREIEAAEREETERILAELTEMLRPLRTSLREAIAALAELDSLHARAAYADAMRCTVPTFAQPEAGWSIEDGRHPLLLARGVAAVPFSLEMAGVERTLVVSGPNTGGKTVLLKAVGLVSAMAQSGIPPTAGPSRLVVFDDYFADIGDEQSIEASLSTFSAHLRNLGEILLHATASSLVLIDELGSGTDPVEGAALGWAILEELTSRGTCTIASSHLGVLKELATQVPGVINGSLQFDAEHLTPTYEFRKGIPGRSYGISIARRLALPEGVVARAEQRVPETERDVAALLERLEQHEKELKAREEELTAMQEDVRQRVRKAADRERRLRERERELERESRSDARKYLLNARAEIDRTLRELKKAGADELEARARAARQHAEHLAARQAEALQQLEAEERNATRRQVPSAGLAAPPVVGDAVLVQTLGGRLGRVVGIRGEDARVAVGSVQLTVPVRTLVRKPPEELESAVPWHGDLPEEHVRSEIDLRGLRADEVDSVVLQALDDAIRAALPTLRIIHGKGTGALRDRVAEMLRKDTRVRQFRLGAWNEGGTGVTVAELG